MTIHRHPITGDPILHAPSRAARPRAFHDAAPIERCPFCPGHESDTPPEIVRVGEPWRVRTFPNKYPAIEGAEVIVESPQHDATFDQIAHRADVVRTYLSRMRAHSEAPHVALFRNEGERAGSSIPHVHSQLVPLPFVPPRIAREIEAFRSADACPLCTVAAHVITETRSFRWIVPAASGMPFQQWIVPVAHVPTLTLLDDEAVAELAELLRRAVAATRAIDASFNCLFLDFPREPRAHAYVELFSRITTIAGLELGTGTFVEIIDPEDAALRLRMLIEP